MERTPHSRVWAPALVMASLVVALAAGCRPSDGDRADARSLDLLPLLAEGELLPATTLAELSKQRTNGEPSRWLGAAYWRPMSALPVEGWGRATELGFRPQGERVTLRYAPRAEAPADAEFLVDFRRRVLDPDPRQPDLERLPADAVQRVEVLWNGERLGGLELPVGFTRGRFPLPGNFSGEADVAFVFDPPLRQARVGSHAVALESCGLVAAGAAPAETQPQWKIDRASERLQLAAPGRFVVPLRVPDDGRELRFDLRRRGAVDVEVLAVTDDGIRHPLLSVAGADGDADDRRSLQAPMAELAGRQIVLVIGVEGDGAAEIRSPRIVLADSRPARDGDQAAGHASEGPASEGPASEGPLPDIVLVVLDAARGDRVANPDVARRPTPNLDRLADEAIVFPNAYSECSSTNCSIPNLITGLPMLETGAGRHRTLDPQATTLAESLKTVGYRTVAFSANPNNSAGRNLDQGFDQFHELWGRQIEDHGPYGMSRRALEVLETRGSEPLFLLLHYLPPHEPYAPTPEFDVYGDPDYDGPIEPGTPPGPYRQNREALTDADAQRFVDLYDGTYRMADDAVSRVLEALRRSDRWDDTILLVTSDHGEAFWEHGEQGHNTTVYEEMVHIPFLLRLPPSLSLRGAQIDTESPVFLGDVVPTLLARVGVEPADGVVGIDLLAGGPAVRAAVFLRTADRAAPTYAVRTARHKLIVRPQTQEQYLFDLVEDAGETHNLVAERPDLVAGLGLRLRRYLDRAAVLGFEAEDAPLSAEDEEVLRSLGYL